MPTLTHRLLTLISMHQSLISLALNEDLLLAIAPSMTDCAIWMQYEMTTKFDKLLMTIRYSSQPFTVFVLRGETNEGPHLGVAVDYSSGLLHPSG